MIPSGLPVEQLRREVAERRDELRLDQLDLPEEVRLARLDLVGLRIAVPRRAALDHVGDVDVGALEADPGEQLLEQLPRLADEGDALLVLVEARRLADEHQLGVGVPRAEHDLRPPLGEPAARAGGNRLLERGELLAPLLGDLDGNRHRGGVYARSRTLDCASARYPQRNWSDDRDSPDRRRVRTRRYGDERSAARARRRAARRRGRARPPLRAGRRDRRGRPGDRAGAVGRPHERRDLARGSRPARAPLRPAPAADVHAPARARAARRRARGGRLGDAGGAPRRAGGSPSCSASSRSTSRTTRARSTTPVLRSRRTTSSRCTVSLPSSSRLQVRRRLRSHR